MYKFLHLCSFLQPLLLIVSVFFALLGTYYLSKSVFLITIAQKYWLQESSKLELKWKIVGVIFGINEQNWTDIFTSDDQLTSQQIKRIRDPFAPIKGFIFVTIGTILQLLVGLLF